MKLNNRLINWMTFVAVNGGLLFGLNMAGISGAITGVQDFFELDQMQTGLAVSSIMIAVWSALSWQVRLVINMVVKERCL